MYEPIIGIDFGTSNSAVSYFSDSGPKLVELYPGQFNVPSAIFFDETKQDYIFGKSAVDRYISGSEGRLLRSLKSILGTSLYGSSTELGNKQVEFKKILESFFKYLKVCAERELKTKVRSAVIGRPVWFVDESPEEDALAQQQLMDVAHACGFDEIYFQYEPIAAGLNYENSLKIDELALVADIGGGTADFSIIRLQPLNNLKEDRVDDILANSGVHVGGTDFDRLLSLKKVMPEFGYLSNFKSRPELVMPNSPFLDLSTWHRIQMLYTRTSLIFLNELLFDAQAPALLKRLVRVVDERLGHRLASDVEKAKIAQSLREVYQMDLKYIDPELSIEVRRTDLESVSDALCQKIRDCIRRCISDAGIQPNDVQTLLLTGGTTAIPFVKSLCAKEVPMAKIVEQDLFGSVALGLAVDARVLTIR